MSPEELGALTRVADAADALHGHLADRHGSEVMGECECGYWQAQDAGLDELADALDALDKARTGDKVGDIRA